MGTHRRTGVRKGEGHREMEKASGSGGSKASFQSTKQEASCWQRNLQMNLMLFYLAGAFQHLKVFRGRHSCLSALRQSVGLKRILNSKPVQGARVQRVFCLHLEQKTTRAHNSPAVKMGDLSMRWSFLGETTGSCKCRETEELEKPEIWRQVQYSRRKCAAQGPDWPWG